MVRLTPSEPHTRFGGKYTSISVGSFLHYSNIYKGYALFLPRNVWSSNCWPATSSSNVCSRVSTSLPEPSRAVSAWYCRSRDQPNNVCRGRHIVQTSLEYINQHASFSHTTNHRLLSEGSLSLIILSFFSAGGQRKHSFAFVSYRSRF